MLGTRDGIVGVGLLGGAGGGFEGALLGGLGRIDLGEDGALVVGTSRLGTVGTVGGLPSAGGFASDILINFIAK
jgi:hypothetical protein